MISLECTLIRVSKQAIGIPYNTVRKCSKIKERLAMKLATSETLGTGKFLACTYSKESIFRLLAVRILKILSQYACPLKDRILVYDLGIRFKRLLYQKSASLHDGIS